MLHAALLFSGELHSTCALDLCRPSWDKILVTWVHTKDSTHQTLDIMDRVRSEVPHFLKVNEGDSKAWSETYGVPVDISIICTG